MKMASWQSIGGPGGKEIPAQTKQMFFAISTDVALLQLGFDWKQISCLTMRPFP